MKTSRNKNIKKINIQNKTLTFKYYMRTKLVIAFLAILLALFALVLRIFFIQKNHSDEYNQKILSQQRYDSRVIQYKRGDIVDRNGTYLALSDKVYNLIIDPAQINSDQEDYLEDTLNLLVEVFGYDREELRNLIDEKSTSHYVRYKKNISYDKKNEFEDRQKEINKEYISKRSSKRIYGVWFEEDYLRKYPYNSLACNVIGFSRGEGSIGTGGIEQYYNSELIGVSGREYGYINDESNLERVIKPAVDGNTIVSTIDMNIQSIVEKYIAEWEAEAKSKVTAVVVMNPNNGEVLALATSRKFDLNNPRDVSGYYTEAELALMSEEEQVNAMNEVWRNFIVNDTYEPGSPSKIFTIAAAMEEGVIHGHESYNCDGSQLIGGWTIRCVRRTGHGMLTVTESLMQSCNDVMMQISAATNRERFSKFMSIFGFGKKTGIDLPGEADTSNLIHTNGDMSLTDLATNSFGQNYNTTMLQTAAAFCSVINGGYYYEPHVVKQILNSKGDVIKDIEPVVIRETVSKSTSDFINEALRKTVAEGTGAAAAVAGYQIGGKTGTAEKYPRGSGKYLVSFAGMAPTSNPQVFCYVVIDEPGMAEQAHSSYASAIFSKIMAEVLPYMNIFPESSEEFFDTMGTELEEGINETSNENIQEGAETSETKVYDRDEVIPNDSLEDAPGEPAGEPDTENSGLNLEDSSELLNGQ